MNAENKILSSLRCCSENCVNKAALAPVMLTRPTVSRPRPGNTRPEVFKAKASHFKVLISKSIVSKFSL